MTNLSIKKLINEIKSARIQMGISQKQLEILSGVKQPVIARLENSSTIPNLKTVIKLLSALDKTIYITDCSPK